MNFLTIPLLSLRQRSFHAAMCVLMMAFSVMAGVLIILVAEHVGERVKRDTAGIDLVVGAQGSPLQIIMASLYHIDIPTGNIPASYEEMFKKRSDIQAVIPLALGDSLRGYRIVGTVPDYVDLYEGRFQSGAIWAKPYEAVLGSDTARQLNLAVGDKFVGAHGLDESDHYHDDRYIVAGVLEPTGSVLDRLILTSVATVQHIHGQDAHEDNHDHHGHHGENEKHEAEVTALLLKVKTPRALINLPRSFNRNHAVVLASPSQEVIRLTTMIGVSKKIVYAFVAGLMAIAAFAVFSGFTSNLESRAPDLAVMRVLGMSRVKITALLFIEAFIMSLFAALLGVVAGHIIFAGLIEMLPPLKISAASAFQLYNAEGIIFFLSVLVGTLAAAIPAMRVYRMDVYRLLTTQGNI